MLLSELSAAGTWALFENTRQRKRVGSETRRNLRAEVTDLQLTCVDANESGGRENWFRQCEKGQQGGVGRAAR